LAQQYQVMSIPTIVFEENGQVVDSVIGTTTKDDLIQRLS
jgi:thioredoxin-like negative regulator of GroEL